MRRTRVTKSGAQQYGEPYSAKSGGLEPHGPLEVYAYACRTWPVVVARIPTQSQCWQLNRRAPQIDPPGFCSASLAPLCCAELCWLASLAARNVNHLRG